MQLKIKLLYGEKRHETKFPRNKQTSRREDVIFWMARILVKLRFTKFSTIRFLINFNFERVE